MIISRAAGSNKALIYSCIHLNHIIGQQYLVFCLVSEAAASTSQLSRSKALQTFSMDDETCFKWSLITSLSTLPI